MNYSLRVTTPAHRDLVHQGRYLAERNPAAARRFLRAVHRTFDRIRSAPDLGGFWREHDADDVVYRCCCVRGFESYVIYYRVLPTSIEIARVLHSAQDADREIP